MRKRIPECTTTVHSHRRFARGTYVTAAKGSEILVALLANRVHGPTSSTRNARHLMQLCFVRRTHPLHPRFDPLCVTASSGHERSD